MGAPQPGERGRMLYIDAGHTARGAHYTGIQRFVRHTLRLAHALRSGQVAAIGAHEGRWSCLAALEAHPLEGLTALPLAGGPPRFDEHSHVLLADRFWHTGEWQALELLLASPARITVVVYDLLSLQQPDWFTAGVGERFARYLRRVLPHADGIVCLSAAVRTDLHAWMRAQGMAAAAIDVVPPGHRVWQGVPEASASLPANWQDGSVPFVLQVGTLEPRKNHALTLAALQRLWDEGCEVGCLFVGQRGWLMDGFIDAMRSLPQWQRRLYWLAECADAQLDWCYRRAAAVVYPSANEGYGLPLAEAAACGAPVIATDTPVHREVARSLRNGGAVLCEAEVDALAAAIRGVLKAPRGAGALAVARNWGDATRELLGVMGIGEARPPPNPPPKGEGVNYAYSV